MSRLGLLPLPDPVIVYRPPNGWTTDNRTRRFTTLAERNHSAESDFDLLSRSVGVLLKEQDERGSFYEDKVYLEGDKIDDQLGGASMLALYLSLTEPEAHLSDALERAVRFHLDHLLNPASPSRPFRYTRYFSDRDSSYDICNNLWCIWGGALVLRHGTPFLSERTARELRELMAEIWSLVSCDPLHGENPCHNQLLAYCDVGILYAHAIGDDALVRVLLEHYHKYLRPLRVYDRGHWIYTEFNEWDAHYALLSLSILEFLFASTGDPALAEDVEEMMLYLNERVSAGGYYWGGSRHNECGFDEFIHVPQKWVSQLGLNRLLLPEPSHLWHKFVMDGHWGRGLVTRMTIPLAKSELKRPVGPTPWHFQKGASSVCLADDCKLHHLSAEGLEIIPAASAVGMGSGLTWLSKGAWKHDQLQARPPKPSQGESYYRSVPFQLAGASGLAAMQRGYTWETRLWWISGGNSLLWIGQVICHGFVGSDKVDYLLGNPVVTRKGAQALAVTEVTTAEGAWSETQGGAAALASRKFLKFGDLFVGATVPLQFLRPSADAFHTFPLPGGQLLRDCAASNQIRLSLSETPRRIDCRESLFFAVEIGRDVSSLSESGSAGHWQANSGVGAFEARLSDVGIWNYTFETSAGKEKLPNIGFGF